MTMARAGVKGEGMAIENSVVINSPLYSPIYPQLGPTVIKGFVKGHGHDFDHIDLNIAFRNALRDKVKLEVVSNPGGQQNLNVVTDLLAMYFTDRSVSALGSRASYVSAALGGSGPNSIEQYNTALGTGLGYSGVVASSYETIARFSRDQGLNYYHQFLDETGWARTIADKYSLVGFSLIGPSQFIPTLTLAGRVKEINPEVRIILGGPWTTHFADELAAAEELHPLYDLIVQGEGEVPMLEVLRSDPGADLRSIPNLWVKGPGGFHPPAELARFDLAALPPPDYSGLDLDEYNSPRPVLVQGNRGCYWGKCAFCVHIAGVHGRKGARVKRRPYENLIRDFEHLVKTYAPRFVSLADVSIAPPVMRKICDALIQKGLKVPWLVFLRFDKGFDRELLELMRQAGCFILHFGMESGSDHVLRAMRKGHDLTVARRILDDATELGFRITLHTMAGLPGETREDLAKTIRLVKEYAPRIHESYTEIFRLERNTSIYGDPAKYGIELIPNDRVFDTSIPFINLNGMDQQEALAMVNAELYGFYDRTDDLIYAMRSHNSLKQKDRFSESSVFKASFKLEHGEDVFIDEVTVSTRGGGILKKQTAE